MASPISPRSPPKKRQRTLLDRFSSVTLPTALGPSHDPAPGSRPVANSPSNLDPDVPPHWKANLQELKRMEKKYGKYFDKYFPDPVIVNHLQPDEIVDALPASKDLLQNPKLSNTPLKYAAEAIYRNLARFDVKLNPEDMNSHEKPRTPQMAMTEQDGVVSLEFKYADMPRSSPALETIIMNKSRNKKDTWLVKDPKHQKRVAQFVKKRMDYYVGKLHLPIKVRTKATISDWSSVSRVFSSLLGLLSICVPRLVVGISWHRRPGPTQHRLSPD